MTPKHIGPLGERLPIVAIVQEVVELVPRLRLFADHRLNLFGKRGALLRWERADSRPQLGELTINRLNPALRMCG